ncbi:MAG: ROK family transcriptional regulator, partial [Nitriliruptorales bacterium]
MALLRAAVGTGAARNKDARQHNLRAVLQAISSAGELSRADIARLTGLARPTASSLVAELLEGDLVTELGVGTSAGGGRPPTLLGVNPQGRAILALDLSRQPFRGHRVDLTGATRQAVEGERRNLRGDEAVDEVRSLIRRLVDGADAPVVGVGIGTPGLVSSDGVVLEAPNLGWHDLPLAERLDDLGVPLWIANDADVAALAEVGSLPPDQNSVVVIKMATGVGAGIVIDGRPVVGARSATGEIGHLVVVDDGPPCSCGNAGCLETVASVPGILRLGALAAGLDPARLDAVPWTAEA